MVCRDVIVFHLWATKVRFWDFATELPMLRRANSRLVRQRDGNFVHRIPGSPLYPLLGLEIREMSDAGSDQFHMIGCRSGCALVPRKVIEEHSQHDVVDNSCNPALARRLSRFGFLAARTNGRTVRGAGARDPGDGAG